jgi:hypothetical protein
MAVVLFVRNSTGVAFSHFSPIFLIFRGCKKGQPRPEDSGAGAVIACLAAEKYCRRAVAFGKWTCKPNFVQDSRPCAVIPLGAALPLALH